MGADQVDPPVAGQHSYADAEHPSPQPSADREPRVYRSWVSITWALIGTGVVTAAAFIGWAVLPQPDKDAFTLPQVLTLLFILLALDAIMLGLAFSTVRADGDGLTVRNGLRRRHYAWSDVAAISYRASDPWANIVPTQVGELERRRRPMVGIQRVDGARAERQVAELKSLLREFNSRS